MYMIYLQMLVSVKALKQLFVTIWFNAQYCEKRVVKILLILLIFIFILF